MAGGAETAEIGSSMSTSYTWNVTCRLNSISFEHRQALSGPSFNGDCGAFLGPSRLLESWPLWIGPGARKTQGLARQPLGSGRLIAKRAGCCVDFLWSIALQTLVDQQFPPQLACVLVVIYSGLLAAEVARPSI